MTPADIRDLADRQDHMSEVAPVLRAFATLLEAARLEVLDTDTTTRLREALRRIMEM